MAGTSLEKNRNWMEKRKRVYIPLEIAQDLLLLEMCDLDRRLFSIISPIDLYRTS